MRSAPTPRPPAFAHCTVRCAPSAEMCSGGFSRVSLRQLQQPHQVFERKGRGRAVLWLCWERARLKPPPNAALASRPWDCRGLLFRICSRFSRCFPLQVTPEVTRTISLPALVVVFRGGGGGVDVRKGRYRTRDPSSGCCCGDK